MQHSIKQAFVIFAILLLLLMLISVFGGSIRYGSSEHFSESVEKSAIIAASARKAATAALSKVGKPAATEMYADKESEEPEERADADAAAAAVEPFTNGNKFAPYN